MIHLPRPPSQGGGRGFFNMKLQLQPERTDAVRMPKPPRCRLAPAEPWAKPGRLFQGLETNAAKSSNWKQVFPAEKK